MMLMRIMTWWSKVREQHISTHLLFIIFTIQSYFVYVASVIYIFFRRAFPRPSITQPNTTTTMTMRRQYMIDNLRSHHRPTRIFLTAFSHQEQQHQHHHHHHNNNPDMNRLLKLLSIPPLLHVTRGSSTSVLTLETANFQMYCKSLSFSSTENKKDSSRLVLLPPNQTVRGSKSNIFHRPNGMVVMFSLKHTTVATAISADNNNRNIVLGEDFNEFCNQLISYICADSLKKVPLIILLNTYTVSEDDDYDSNSIMSDKKNSCSRHDRVLNNEIADMAYDLIEQVVQPPQIDWTVNCICTCCGYNVYQSFDWICNLTQQHSRM